MKTIKTSIGNVIRFVNRVWKNGIHYSVTAVSALKVTATSAFKVTVTSAFKVKVQFLKTILSYKRHTTAPTTIVGAVVLLATIFFLFPDFILSIWCWLGMGADITNSEILRNIFLFVGGPLALCIAFWRSNTANRQQKTDARARLDERFQKGSDMLGSDKLVVRMSGITILDRLSSEHTEDFHDQVVKLLGKFIKHPISKSGSLEVADLQEALIAISRIGEQEIFEHSRRMLDIAGSNFGGVKLTFCDFLRIDFTASNFGQKAKILSSRFRISKLKFVTFDKADFVNVSFLNSTLGASSFVGAELRRVRFINSGLSDTNFSGTTIVKGRFINSVANRAQFSNATLLESHFFGTRLYHANFFWRNFN